MSEKKTKVSKERNKRNLRIAKYERERQMTINKIRNKEKYIKTNWDDLSEREIQKEQIRIHYLNNYCDFITRKLERNRE